jgi:histidinol-phosphate phosphatase family protein
VPDSGALRRPRDLNFYPSVGEALRNLRRAGARLVVVSNQAAVARGLLDARDLARMDRRLRALARRAGAPLDAVYYCPHHPEFGRPCSCRKPAPGMLRRGLRAFGIDPAHSFMIGDHATDLEAGRRAGLTTVLVLTGHGRRHRREAVERGLADKICRNAAFAARWILEERARERATVARPRHPEAR